MASSTTSSINTSTQDIFSGKLEKIKLKCEKCGKPIAEFYTKGAIIRDIICKPCHQIDKLTE